MIEVVDKIPNDVLSSMGFMGHEQVVFCNDKKTGLKAIIAIHDTTLGPALGGTRMWNYNNEIDALNDVLRLSRGMTFKAAISGLNLGGGKAVIIGDSYKEKTEQLMKSFGNFVESLGGKYITAEDVGMTPQDMEYVRSTTKHVTGIPESMGGSGDPSVFTAYGVYMGMKASAKFKWGSDCLHGKRVLVQGVGHVGYYLMKHLLKEGAEVIISDIDNDKVEKYCSKYGVTSVEPHTDIYSIDMDIYSPCALGATLDSVTIPKLKCSIVAGAANNQCADENIHSELIYNRGIVYAPDFLINAGGLINVYSEIKGYNREKSLLKTKEIYDTTLEILLNSETNNITPQDSAMKIALNRLHKK